MGSEMCIRDRSRADDQLLPFIKVEICGGKFSQRRCIDRVELGRVFSILLYGHAISQIHSRVHGAGTNGLPVHHPGGLLPCAATLQLLLRHRRGSDAQDLIAHLPDDGFNRLRMRPRIESEHPLVETEDPG